MFTWPWTCPLASDPELPPKSGCTVRLPNIHNVLLILILVLTGYINNDYPDTLQIHLGHPYVALHVEDSEHYSIRAPEGSAPDDVAEIEAEWASLFPSGNGFIHVGPHGREFTISMFHQLHCINNIRLALGLRPPSLYHIQHCMNYLRQMILCASNTRLEPMSRRLKESRNVTAVDGLGLTHVCRDWGAVYQLFEDERTQWKRRVETL